MSFPGAKASGAPPTAAELSKGFGFDVPADFVRLVAAVWEVARGDARVAERVFEHVMHVTPEGPKARHPDLTPWEFFPLGGTGGDGEHYGYLVLAPELAPVDGTLASFLPGTGELCLIGTSTRDAVENLVAAGAAEGLRDDVRAVLQLLGWSYDPARAERVGAFAPVPRPAVPQGYRYVPTSNGVGVLAPVGTFGPEPPGIPPKRSLARMYAQAARVRFDAGYFGDALVLLNEGRTDAAVVDGDDGTGELLELLTATWGRLGRRTPWS